LAPNKMAAKIASDLKKPDGLVVVTEKGLLDFLRPLEITRVPGLGKKTGQFLYEHGIRTIGDMAGSDPRELVRLLGKCGYDFWQLANGCDDRAVVSGQEAKSVSNEVTFDEDTADRKTIESALLNLCENVSRRLREAGTRARTVTLKIRLQGFKTYTRSETIPCPTNFTDELYLEIKKLYNGFQTRSKIRLVGVKCSGLTLGAADADLFSGSGKIKKEKIHNAIDRIREKFGDESIWRAALK
jgi:DNA polymerase IV